MTGGHDSHSTEILRDKNWTVLENGNLPGGSKIFGLGLINIDNQVFAFGKTKKYPFLIINYMCKFQVVMSTKQSRLPPQS